MLCFMGLLYGKNKVLAIILIKEMEQITQCDLYTYPLALAEDSNGNCTAGSSRTL